MVLCVVEMEDAVKGGKEGLQTFWQLLDFALKKNPTFL